MINDSWCRLVEDDCAHVLSSDDKSLALKKALDTATLWSVECKSCAMDWFICVRTAFAPWVGLSGGIQNVPEICIPEYGSGHSGMCEWLWWKPPKVGLALGEMPLEPWLKLSSWRQG